MLDFTMSISMLASSVSGASCDLLSGPGGSSAADPIRTLDATIGTALLIETGVAVIAVSLPPALDTGVLELLESAVDDVLSGKLALDAAGLVCTEVVFMVGIEDDPRGPDCTCMSTDASPTDGLLSEAYLGLVEDSTADE